MDNKTKLQEALASFGPGMDLTIPSIAKYRCGSISYRLTQHLTACGIESNTFMVCGLRDNPNPSSVYPADFNWGTFGHTVVVVDDTWIDFTAKQISDDYPVPHICDAQQELRKWKHLDGIT